MGNEKQAGENPHEDDSDIGKVWALEVRPRSQRNLLLGDFTDIEYKGFEIVITPDVVPDDAVVSQVIQLEEAGRKKLYMHVENFDDRAIEARVKQL
jgi:hypothetical protein